MPKFRSRCGPAVASLPRLALGGVGWAVLLALAGCQQEAVRHYQADRVAQRERTRLVAVLVPRNAETWFFKLQGPEDAVDNHVDEFNEFLKTVHFTDADPPVVWKLPEGWQQEPGGAELRYATLHFGSKDGPLEVTVTKLGREASDLGPNVNRWRRQIGLGPLAETELPSITENVKIDGIDSELVSLVGPGTEKPSASPHPPPVADDAGPPLRYDTPPGWREVPDANALLAFEVADGGQTAKATVTPFGGNGGGLLLNVNRWRGQVGLDPINEDGLKDLPTLSVDGTAAPYVDLASPGGGRRMLGAIASRPGVTWFFKMTGPGDLIGKQKTAFETFVKSVRFQEDKGAPHE